MHYRDMAGATHPSEHEFYLLGIALFSAQRAEYILYGIAAHVSKFPEAQKDRRLRDLTGERFIRGDSSEFKMTFGQLSKLLGVRLLLDADRLEAFVTDRNLVAHNYFREFHISFRGKPARTDPEQFLRKFIEEALWWNNVFEGLMVYLRQAFAKRDGREGEYPISEHERAKMAVFERQVVLPTSAGACPVNAQSDDST